MAPILAPLLGVLFSRGHISLKNRTYHPLFRDSTSPFKSTCLLINRIGAMAVYIRPLFGVLFYGGVSPSKIGLIAPY
jgi:hypothetical protein